MDKAKLIALIAILYALEIEARAEMVKNAAKENNVKEGELFKLLKEAGYEPKAPKGTATPNGADIQQQSDNKTPPDGGQAKIGNEQFTPWVEKLKAEPDKSKRNEIVADLCKEKSLKIGDAWKFLEEAGFDPQSSLNGGQDRKVTVLASHKTDYEKYRCAGLVLTHKPENHLVTEAQFEKLNHDPWVVVSK